MRVLISINNCFDRFLTKFHLKNYKDIILFLMIIFLMHLIWRVWGYYFNHKIFGYGILAVVTDTMLHWIKEQSAWILNTLLREPTLIKGEYLVFDNYSYIGVTYGCSGIKQFYQFTGLILLFYGPWKKKLWYIPVGLVVLHLTNLFRVVTLSLVVIYRLDRFSPLHDWVFRPLFYVIMFLLWVYWVEKLAKESTSEVRTEESV